MDNSVLIAKLQAKIDTLKLEGERNVANLIGEYNGRVAELQSTIALLNEPSGDAPGPIMVTPSAPDLPILAESPA